MTVANSHFKFIRSHEIEALKVTVEEYQHKVTGALHYHLASDAIENVFLVALRTVPMDSTGVAHILEHTALCGSEKYPVRDPFFMMIRRSLNTFMNAFTSSDWTAYPFATENNKDFQNLLQVYLDAVFFPNLDPLDFAQEGHRLEFAEMENPASELTFKGVVFNEMKGAMSSPSSTLWQKFTESLYPTSTYHYNSGGEPTEIPKLTYEDFVAFHKTHYHPSNAIFMTFGAISAAAHQTQFENLALSRFDSAIPVVQVQPEARRLEPIRVTSSYAFNEPDLTRKTHIVVGWLLGENKDPMDVLKGHLLSAVLLDNSASPLRKVLEGTDLASAPSQLCGLEDSNREMIFAAGVRGSDPEHEAAIEALILDELKRIVAEGIDAQQLESALHQLELSQREVGGGSYPYGLQLMLTALSGAMHGGDPIALLDVDSVLAQLRESIQDPNFIPELIQTWLLDNPHRVTLVLKPDDQLAEQQAQAEKAVLQAIQTKLSNVEKQAIVDKALALQARQDAPDDASLLPEVTKQDVPVDIKQCPPKFTEFNHSAVTGYQVGTNGLVYQQMIVSMPALTADEQAVLPLFNTCLPDVGSGGRDYLATQMRQAAVTGGVSARVAVHSKLADAQQFHANYILSGKALNRNHVHLSDLLRETLQTASFEETARIEDLITQIRSGIDQGVTGNGHGLAMSAAKQNFTPVAQWQFQRQGFAGIQQIKQQFDLLKSPDGMAQLVDNFSNIQHKLLAANKQALLISDETGLAPASEDLVENWQDLLSSQSNAQGLQLTASQQTVRQAWVTNTQVNFCAKAFPAVGSGHEDAPVLSVLGACLRNGYLHSAIREKGGAYGGGATFDAESSAFCFYSYRDPRLMKTYEDFALALDWLGSNELTQAKVDEAILNVISAMDKPSSPAGEAKKAFYQNLYGKSYEVLMTYRQRVLNTTVADIRAVAERYLIEDKASFAVLTHEKGAKEMSTENFEVIQL